MYIILFDRGDRLGANIINYIAQILYAHKNKYIIKFNKNKKNYRYYHSIFVKILFDYIDIFNEELYKMNRYNRYNIIFSTHNDWIHTTSCSLQNIKTDFISYFHNNIYNHIKINFINLSYNYNIPFDINKTILVHLRLDDVTYKPDYDGSECSQYYKNKILNNEICYYELYDRVNMQAPLSKIKLENIINKAKKEFNGYKVILITSPNSDTSFLDYEVIKNYDESLDLYLLTMCKVVILSRSTFSLASEFFNDNKIKTYIPLWGHFVCCGLDTIYDKNNKFEYFY